MSGTISLILPNGTKEKEVHYYSTKSWKAIIESWVCLYGDKFENFHVHIQPTFVNYLKRKDDNKL